ncbi:MAG: enoyl-CoA hydratase [Corynebacterium sp.]|nr:enoyl-CoA hydratase [Corynebacterium sp.]
MTALAAPVVCELHDGVKVIRLNRPAKRNALTADMCRMIASELPAADAAPSAVRAVLLAGQGPAFCAGADLGSGAESGVYGSEFHTALFGLLQAIVATPVPVIADIQGPAVGAGTQVALACDVRLAGPKAWFGVPAAALGFALDGWTIQRAQSLLGGAVARNMLLSNQRVSVEQASAVGFVIPQLPGEALGFAQEVAGLAPLAMQQLKVALNEHDSSYQLGARAQELFDVCWSSADAQEARQARVEKRAPVFHGR